MKDFIIAISGFAAAMIAANLLLQLIMCIIRLLSAAGYL